MVHWLSLQLTSLCLKCSSSNYFVNTSATESTFPTIPSTRRFFSINREVLSGEGSLTDWFYCGWPLIFVVNLNVGSWGLSSPILRFRIKHVGLSRSQTHDLKNAEDEHRRWNSQVLESLKLEKSLFLKRDQPFLLELLLIEIRGHSREGIIYGNSMM